jgi:hypothetical protein
MMMMMVVMTMMMMMMTDDDDDDWLSYRLEGIHITYVRDASFDPRQGGRGGAR